VATMVVFLWFSLLRVHSQDLSRIAVNGVVMMVMRLDCGVDSWACCFVRSSSRMCWSDCPPRSAFAWG